MASFESRSHGISSNMSAELEAANSEIGILRNIMDDMAQQLQRQSQSEVYLKNRIEQLETVINLQSENQQKLEQEIGTTNIQLRKHINSLFKDLEEKSKIIRTLKKELLRERRVNDDDSEIRLKNETVGAGHQTDNQLDDSGIIASDESIDAHDQMDSTSDASALQDEHEIVKTVLDYVKGIIVSPNVDKVDAVQNALREMMDELKNKYAELVEKCIREENKNSKLIRDMHIITRDRNRYKAKLATLNCFVEKIRCLKKAAEKLKEKEEECESLKRCMLTMKNNEIKRQQESSGETNKLRGELANSNQLTNQLMMISSRYQLDLAICQKRVEILARYIEAQRVMGEGTSRELNIVKNGNMILTRVISNMETELQITRARNNERKFTEEARNDVVSPSEKLLQGLNNAPIGNLIDTQVSPVKEMTTWENNNGPLSKVGNSESQISQEITTSITPRALSAGMVKSLQQLYILFLRHREHRKALAFQKRYLINVAGTYNIRCEQLLLERTTVVYRKSAKVRFRSAVLVLISIRRLKWCVLRWTTGDKVSTDTVLRKFEKSVTRISSNHCGELFIDRIRN